MPGPSSIPRGNILNNFIISATLTPAAVPPNTSAEQTFTVTGLQTTDDVSVSKPTWQAGLAIVNDRVSAANTVAIAFGNFTAATITPTAAEVYIIEVNRPDPSETMTSVV